MPPWPAWGFLFPKTFLYFHWRTWSQYSPSVLSQNKRIIANCVKYLKPRQMHLLRCTTEPPFACSSPWIHTLRWDEMPQVGACPQAAAQFPSQATEGGLPDWSSSFWYWKADGMSLGNSPWQTSPLGSGVWALSSQHPSSSSRAEMFRGQAGAFLHMAGSVCAIAGAPHCVYKSHNKREDE